MIVILAGLLSAQTNEAVLSVSGTWGFQADPNDVGVTESWFLRKFRDTIRLPGSMVENGKGDALSVTTKWTGHIVDRSWFTAPEYAKYREPGRIKVPFWLTPNSHYVGAAWYQKDIAISEAWEGRRLVCFLERAHWETRLWVDGREAGLRNSLGTPHEYDLTELLAPGPHTLTVRVDNRIKDIDVGQNAHSVSNHTQSNWNGLVGRLELRAFPAVSLGDIQVFPDVAAKTVRVAVEVVNRSRRTRAGTLVISAESVEPAKDHSPRPRTTSFKVEGDAAVVEIVYALGSEAVLWDEFSPNLYLLTVTLESQDIRHSKSVPFGLREFKAQGTRFAVNGRPVFLRGTLECCIFPKTGYPPTDPAEWKRIFAVCRAHGLNHMRFHSYCPPAAAFDAADRMGFYLYVECEAWTEVGTGKPFDAWLYAESERIVRAYGNHPSFCMMSYGNEPGGKAQERFLGDFVAFWKKKDARRVYTSAAGWPLLPENDWHSTPDPRIQAWGAGLGSLINKEPPRSNYDWRTKIAALLKPVVSHEIGQWCVYPNFKEIDKYTGPLKARNFEIFRDSLAARGLGALAGDFLLASGKLQALCYKADIEAALRTPGFAGFELLDLHDFPGQGTALVGVLDPFWEGKGYIAPEEFRRFCDETVPLARMAKMVFLNTETCAAEIEVAHFGRAPLQGVVPEWAITDSAGAVVWKGRLAGTDIPLDNAVKLGRIEVPLDKVLKAKKFILSVSVGRFRNTWDFWVYPAKPGAADPGSVLVVRRLDGKALAHLRTGGNVFLIAEKGAVRSDQGENVAVGFSSIFWNTAWTGKHPPHTLGILCDPLHPALADFPTEFHSNWQWWDAMSHTQAVNVESLGPGFKPIVRVIDDWFTNRSLALVFEARAGGGKLLVSSIDLLTDAAARPEARQLYSSLLSYMQNSAFHPSAETDIWNILRLFKDDSGIPE